METNCGKGVQESNNRPSQDLGGELALLMPYVAVGIKETKKKEEEKIS